MLLKKGRQFCLLFSFTYVSLHRVFRGKFVVKQMICIIAQFIYFLTCKTYLIMVKAADYKKMAVLGLVIAVGFVGGNILLGMYNKQFSSFSAPQYRKGGKTAARRMKR